METWQGVLVVLAGLAFAVCLLVVLLGMSNDAARNDVNLTLLEAQRDVAGPTVGQIVAAAEAARHADTPAGADLDLDALDRLLQHVQDDRDLDRLDTAEGWRALGLTDDPEGRDDRSA